MSVDVNINVMFIYLFLGNSIFQIIKYNINYLIQQQKYIFQGLQLQLYWKPYQFLKLFTSRLDTNQTNMQEYDPDQDLLDLQEIQSESFLGSDGTKGRSDDSDEQFISNIDKVISIEGELEMLKKENMNPQDIYLKHCQQFADSNFDRQTLTVKDYRITQKDIDSRVIAKDFGAGEEQPLPPKGDGRPTVQFSESIAQLNQRLSRQSNLAAPAAQKSLQNLNNQSNMFQHTSNLTIQTNATVPNKQVSGLIGYQQSAAEQGARKRILIDDQYDTLDIKITPEILLVNGKQQMIVKTWETIERKKNNLQSSTQKNHPIHIKTLRIYDAQNKEKEQILTEQIDAKINNNRNYYNTSTIQFQNCIYYFKRIYDEFQESSLSNATQGYKISSPQCEGEQVYGAGEDEQSETPESFCNSYLQLYKYDLLYFEEEIVDGYQLLEYNDDDRTFNILFSKCMNPNITDRNENDKEYKNEEQFLRHQYLLAQQYIRDEEEMDFALFCMQNLDTPLHHESPESQQNKNYSTTKQIQYFNHLLLQASKNAVLSQSNHKVLFILISANQHMHMVHDVSQCLKETVKVFKMNHNQDKIDWPNLFIQSIEVKCSEADGKNEMVQRQLFYYVDNKNKVRLIYPNYEIKSDKYKYIDMINKRKGYNNQDYRQNKQIVTIDYTNPYNIHRIDSMFQYIQSLRKIINLKDIDEHQHFIFCKEEHDQVLYITTPNINQITTILVRDHHCEECYDDLDTEQIKNQIFNQVGDKLQQLFHKTNNKSKKQLTRMTKIKNHVEYRFTFDVNNLCQDVIEDEEIEMDIDNNKVSVIQHVKGNNVYQCESPLKMGQAKNLTRQRIRNCFHVTLEDSRGVLWKIATAEPKNQMIQQMKTELVQRNVDYYIFVMSILIQKSKKGYFYFFIRKTVAEIKLLIRDREKQQRKGIHKSLYLVNEEDNIQVVGKSHTLIPMQFKDFTKYQDTVQQSVAKISFEKLVDINCHLNFAAVVYQESYQVAHNELLIYDIDEMYFAEAININPNKTNIQYMYVDDQGYNCFKIVRSGEMIDKSRENCHKDVQQQQSFHVFILYIENLGRIQGQEFLIKQIQDGHKELNCNYSSQLVGQKQIFLSNKVVKTSDWKVMKNSIVIPFIDQNHHQQGCQFILYHQNNKRTFLNLLDQEINNLYTYESNIVQIGSKRFEINHEEHTEYLIVVCAKIKNDIVEKNIFNQQETFKILRKMQELIISMKCPDLHFILQNTFKTLILKDFFAPLQLLYGKSLCDICLSDPAEIKDGLERLRKQNKMCGSKKNSTIEYTVINDILQHDQMREEIFKKIDFYPSNKIINYDFNFNSTVFRGIKMKSLQSISYLMDFLFTELNNSDYKILIMMDLYQLMESEFQSKIIQFFEESEAQRKNLDRTKFCNMETPYFDTEIEKFSRYPVQEIAVDQFKDLHDIESEVKSLIKQREIKQMEDRLQEGEHKRDNHSEYPIEHSFIDFNWLVIGDKIHSINDLEKIENMQFNHLFYAKLFLLQFNNLKFYGCQSIQKLIDFQYKISRQFMMAQFWFYIIFYVFPYCITLTTVVRDRQIFYLKICIIPQILLMGIKIIQFYVIGCKFLYNGWNIIDITQIIFFQILLQTLIFDENSESIKFIKIFLILLTFLKLVHLLIVYEEFGFFIKMITFCMRDLKPFFISYLFFCNFFVTLYSVMDVDIDDELLTPGAYRYMGKYGLLFLAVWRNSVGKLGLPNYNALVKSGKKQGAGLMLEVDCIWIIYVIQILFNLVIGLNFMIAIIESSYTNTMQEKDKYQYRNKASLNVESLEILQFFPYFQTNIEFRAIILSNYREEKEETIVIHGTAAEMKVLMEVVKIQLEQNFAQLKKQEKIAHLIDNLITHEKKIQSIIDTDYKNHEMDIDKFHMEYGQYKLQRSLM